MEKRLVLLRKRTNVILFKDRVIFNSRRRVGRVESSRCLRSDAPAIITKYFKGGKNENNKHGTCETMCRKLEEDLSYASHLNLHAVIIRTYRPRFDDDVRSAFETFDEAVSARGERY